MNCKRFLLIFLVLASPCVFTWDYKPTGSTEPCLHLTADLTFGILYNMIDTSNVNGFVSVNMEVQLDSNTTGVSITGQCFSDASPKSQLSLKWETYTLDFEFVKDLETDLWHASLTQLAYDERAFRLPYLPAENKVTRNVDGLFSSRVSHSYSCSHERSYQLFELKDSILSDVKQVDVKTSDLTIVPFTGLTGVDKCSADEVPTDTPAPKPEPTKKPVHPTEPAPKPDPKPEPHKGGPSGSKVAWVCTLLSVLVLAGAGVMVYINRDATPPFLNVI